MKCPRCSKEILLVKHKYKQVDCQCGAKLLLAIVNGKQEIHDLTPNKGEKN